MMLFLKNTDFTLQDIKTSYELHVDIFIHSDGTQGFTGTTTTNYKTI